MLGKFLGGAEQNTNGQFIEGDIYVITGYNYGTDCVEAAGLHSNQTHMVDASAFEVVRNEMHTFQHGHLQGLGEHYDRGTFHYVQSQHRALHITNGHNSSK